MMSKDRELRRVYEAMNIYEELLPSRERSYYGLVVKPGPKRADDEKCLQLKAKSILREKEGRAVQVQPSKLESNPTSTIHMRHGET